MLDEAKPVQHRLPHVVFFWTHEPYLRLSILVRQPVEIAIKLWKTKNTSAMFVVALARLTSA